VRTDLDSVRCLVGFDARRVIWFVLRSDACAIQWLLAVGLATLRRRATLRDAGPLADDLGDVDHLGHGPDANVATRQAL
jgi:hypothetical protein